MSSISNSPAPAAPKSSQPLAPPPELTYHEQKALVDAIQAWAREHGYALVIKTSCFKDQRFIYQCDKSGSYKSETKDGKLGQSRKTNCPFRLSGNYYKKSGTWQVKIQNPEHNHPPSNDPSVHAIHRRIPHDKKDLVTTMTEAGVKPLKIKNALMQDSEIPLTSSLSTIYNYRNQIRRKALDGNSPIEALILELRKLDFYHEFLNEEGKISSLFIAHPHSIQLAVAFPTTFLLDCTYKKNKFNMPLLHISGINGSNKSFSVAFCFLSQEKKDNYIWALQRFQSILQNQSPKVLVTDKEQALINAIETVFPASTHLLCCWHIFKNIQLHCQKYFKSEDEWSNFRLHWNYLCSSKSPAIYQQNFTQLSIHWNPPTSDYLISNWLPLKNKFVAYSTDQHPHFHNCNTSRIEGLHAYVQRFISSSAGSLHAVVKQIYQAISVQIHERKLESSQQTLKSLKGLPLSLEPLSGLITHFALRNCHSYFSSKDKSTNCVNCLHSSSMGMPCIHKIREYQAKGKAFELSDFHPQWHLKNNVV